MNLQKLIHSIQSNDDELSFNELYRQLSAQLCQFAYSFVGEIEPAEEIVNDIFLKLWLNRKHLEGIRSIKVYLFVAVKNSCFNYARSVSSKEIKQLAIAEAYYFHLPENPEQLLVSKELKLKILNAVDALPPRCKLIFKMVKQDGLSCNDVARLLNISNKTVLAQLAIALKKLELLIA